MINFEHLRRKHEADSTVDPIKLFEGLRKTVTIHELYSTQADVLRKWDQEFRASPDVLIKMNTGAGKTVVGLLISLSLMKERGQGALYLVDNRQLVEQVVSQAQMLGIPARAYSGRASIDAKFNNGDIIVVASYQALFNGRSVFGLSGEPGICKVSGIVIDDAHSACDTLEEVFSLKIPARGSTQELYRELVGLFHGAFIKLGREGLYDDFMLGAGGRRKEVIEIPYWTWIVERNGVARRIFDYVAQLADADDFKKEFGFVWPLLGDSLRYCNLIVSHGAVTIHALYPLVDLLPTFTEAPTRVYMSGTMDDHSDLIRTFGIENTLENRVLSCADTVGVGRRLILPLDDDIAASEEFCEFLKSELEQGAGVVRISPFDGDEPCYAKSIPYCHAVGHDDVSHALNKQRNDGSCRILGLANRYNGIDLPGATCRVLIISGLPTGINDADSLNEIQLRDSSVYSRKTARRIEQGIGRGTRGSGDYCLVLLEGEELIDWVNTKKNRSLFTVGTQAQLEIGEEMMGQLEGTSEVCEVMGLGVSEDDEEWPLFHSEMLQKVSEKIRSSISENNDSDRGLMSAVIERKAYRLWREGNYAAGIAALIKDRGDDDVAYGGCRHAFAARIAFDGDRKMESYSYLKEAHARNYAFSCYNFLHEKDIEPKYVNQATVLMEDRDKAIAAYRKMRSVFRQDDGPGMQTINYKRFEEGVRSLGEVLGFQASREDNGGRGPDVVWVSPDDLCFVIEAKNNKKVDSPFSKNEAGQLRNSMAWGKRRYPSCRVVGVSIHPNTMAHETVPTDGLLVMTLEELGKLISDVYRLYDSAMPSLEVDSDVSEVALVLQGAGFSGGEIVEKYCTSFRH